MLGWLINKGIVAHYNHPEDVKNMMRLAIDPTGSQNSATSYRYCYQKRCATVKNGRLYPCAMCA